jgi:hypothetical protein
LRAFVSQGTIEEGMLSVIKFKKSLFAGALDGGESEVFLGGSRLNNFIKIVEKATGAIPEVVDQPTPAAEAAAGASTSVEPSEAKSRAAAPAAQSRALAALLQTGLDLLQQIAAAAKTGGDGGGKTNGSNDSFAGLGASFEERDAATGKPYFRLPVPSPELLDRALQAVGSLLELFRR